jgi:hypothetical protein
VGEQGEKLLAESAALAQPVVMEPFGHPAIGAGPKRDRVLRVAGVTERPFGGPALDQAGATAADARLGSSGAVAAQRLALGTPTGDGPRSPAPRAGKRPHPP